jgi:hypothetical protein
MQARRFLPFVIVLVVTMLARISFAQTTPPPLPTPSAQDLAEAKKHFDVGLKLYGEHACLEARVEFEAAYKLAHRYSALKNIAQCDRELKQFAAASEAYQQILDLHSAQISAADRATVKRAIEELSILIGTLTINVNEPDADVELDGKSLGRSPLAGAKKVALGSHAVRVTKPGFEPYEKEVAISSEQALALDVTLDHEVLTGHLAVREQNGRDVHVLVDEKDQGPAPWEGDLAPGDHVVVVKSDTFASESRTVKIVRKERVDLALEATSLLGHLRVTTLPASAAIAIDGKNVGTGAWEGDITTGAHHIEVTVAGFPSSVRDVTLQRGQLVAQEIPVPAALAGSTGPEYAGVYVRMNAVGVASPTSTAVFANGADDDFHFGLGGTLRIGYSLDKLPFAFEFAGAFMVDHYDITPPSIASSSSTSTQSNNGRADVTGVDVFLGAGARVTSRDALIRFTFGVAPGIAIHNLNVDDGAGSGNNSCTGTTACNSASNQSFQPGYVAPGFMLDGGMLVGSTPGAKFFLGVNAWLDFASTINVGPDTQYSPTVLYSGRALRAVSGPQFYLGPTIGVQFGH